MEITNEIKAKVFASYLGHRIKMFEQEFKLAYTDLNNSGRINKSEHNIEHCKLILRPLSEITDEDAIEVGKINRYLDCNHHTSK